MWLIKLAWKNLWRNRGRTFITVAAIFFAVVLSITTASLQKGVFDNLIKNVVSFYTGYVQVHKKGYQDEQILDNSFTASTAIEKKILSHKNITELTPRLESFALASSGNITKGCMVTGILPEKEDAITFLKNKLVKGSFIGEKDLSVLLTQGLAQKFKLDINDTIILIGQGYHGSTAAGKYHIKGILKFGSPQLNDRMLFMSLANAQTLFGADGMITSYILSVRDEKEIESYVALLRTNLGKDYEVLPWGELLPDIKQHIASDSNNMKIIQGILYLLICFGIFSTLLMMMIERRFEMGMLVAIGMRKSKLIILFIIESVFSVLIGCILGILASIPLVYFLKLHPVRLGGETAKAYERFGFEAIFPTATDASIFITQGIIVLIIGMILSLYPVLKVIRLKSITAMKR